MLTLYEYNRMVPQKRSTSGDKSWNIAHVSWKTGRTSLKAGSMIWTSERTSLTTINTRKSIVAGTN